VRRAWAALPADLRILTAAHPNRSALDQRADLADLYTSLRPDLEAKGMVFNEGDKARFRERLAEVGFYKEWRGRYGDAAWAMLEKYSDKLS
jgi:TRAP-type C4-dicarboxylate transport system substrate-binding protein